MFQRLYVGDQFRRALLSGTGSGTMLVLRITDEWRWTSYGWAARAYRNGLSSRTPGQHVCRVRSGWLAAEKGNQHSVDNEFLVLFQLSLHPVSEVSSLHFRFISTFPFSIPSIPDSRTPLHDAIYQHVGQKSPTCASYLRSISCVPVSR